MDEKEKKVPEEEGKKEPAEIPAETSAEKSEKKTEEKTTEKSDEKPENSKEEPKADEPSKEEEPTEEAPTPASDGKDEEILRLKTQIAAMQLGVKPDCMEDVVAIAESYVKSGTASDINAALTSVVKKYPDMKAEGGKSDGKKQGGFKVGADSDKQDKPDDSKLSAAFGIKKKK